jgi:hypothetical protein
VFGGSTADDDDPSSVNTNVGFSPSASPSLEPRPRTRSRRAFDQYRSCHNECMRSSIATSNLRPRWASICLQTPRDSRYREPPRRSTPPPDTLQAYAADDKCPAYLERGRVGHLKFRGNVLFRCGVRKEGRCRNMKVRRVSTTPVKGNCCECCGIGGPNLLEGRWLC